MTTSSKTVVITTMPKYMPEHSSEADKKYAFSYTITISNVGTEPTQLISRHWIITDANGEVTEVEGQGVIGEQPIIGPNESYTYTSGAMLDTPVGTMQGSYQMKNQDGAEFDAEIPVFRLALPNSLH